MKQLTSLQLRALEYVYKMNVSTVDDMNKPQLRVLKKLQYLGLLDHEGLTKQGIAELNNHNSKVLDITTDNVIYVDFTNKKRIA